MSEMNKAFDRIEDLIARHEITAAQAFTAMRQAAQSELAAARDEAERLRLWAAGLESVLQEIAERDKARQYESCPDCFHKCSRETGCHSMRFSSTGDLANGALLGANSGAWLLHKQAEAVESMKFPVILRKMWAGSEVDNWVKKHAQNLRNQAEELEAGGGS